MSAAAGDDLVVIALVIPKGKFANHLISCLHTVQSRQGLRRGREAALQRAMAGQQGDGPAGWPFMNVGNVNQQQANLQSAALTQALAVAQSGQQDLYAAVKDTEAEYTGAGGGGYGGQWPCTSGGDGGDGGGSHQSVGSGGRLDPQVLASKLASAREKNRLAQQRFRERQKAKKQEEGQQCRVLELEMEEVSGGGGHMCGRRVGQRKTMPVTVLAAVLAAAGVC